MPVLLRSRAAVLPPAFRPVFSNRRVLHSLCDDMMPGPYGKIQLSAGPRQSAHL